MSSVAGSSSIHHACCTVLYCTESGSESEVLNLPNLLDYSGIEIHVTLYHLDFPQILEDEYHGWLSPRVV